jgi:peptidase E
MTAAQPTIIATSIGLTERPGLPDGDAGPSFEYAARLARAGQHPRLCIIGTAGGDDATGLMRCYAAFCRLGMLVSHLSLFPQPSVPDVREHLLSQDIIWVGGGSTANLLAVWRVHGLDAILADCWAAGIVLSGVSAGSLCWHTGGTTDSFGLPLQPVTNGLGFLPYSHSPHYDAEPGRRPLTQRLIAEGVLADGFATDNGTALVFHGTDLHEAITEVPGASAYQVSRAPGGRAVEEVIPAREL